MVNDGVNTDRCIDTVRLPAFAMTAPVLGATSGATTATASETHAAMAARRFVDRPALIFICTLPPDR